MDRRQVLRGLGALPLAGYGERCLSALAANEPGSTAAAACVVTPAATEGPFFIDDAFNRSDLTSGTRAPAVIGGMPLALNVNVQRVRGIDCTPLVGARIDLWHSDADGVYSAPAGEGTPGESYLRGYQVTDSTGAAHFTTIYPGWYRGRTPHIHFKVRGEGFEFTSQWYFDDAISDEVFTAPPYSRRGARTRRNGGDFLFDRRMLLALQQNKLGAGYLAAAAIGIRV
jgi:protocatechuate 3,4-dioxygenase beta subunit